LLSSPNIQDINDRNISFFSPQPYFIGAFFFPQQLLQVAWLYRLWKLNPQKPGERAELDRIGELDHDVMMSDECTNRAQWIMCRTTL
jgi:hypothetical protein